MIRKVRVENYKLHRQTRLDLGRLTVLIGANGSGKSNILEAIALASATAQNKLDNEFLISRGIRVTETRFHALGVRQFLSTSRIQTELIPEKQQTNDPRSLSLEEVHSDLG